MRSKVLMWLSLLFVSLAVQPAVAQGVASAPVPAQVAAAPAPVSGDLKGTDGYRLVAGDKVKIAIYNEDTLSGQYEISGAGMMSLPLIGEVPVAGRSVPEVIAFLTKTLKDGGYMLNPSVSMEVLNYRPFYVLGEIKDPGKYAYVSDMNVLNAVALAGGYTYRAKKDKVLIIRASDPEKKEQVAKPGDQVMPGDIIRVPERFF